MSTRSKKKLTVDRTKALRFIAKQEFYKMEETAEAKGNVRVLERDWYKNATDNESYAQQICTYAIQRHLSLLENFLSKMNPKDPTRMQHISTRDHLKQRTQMCINNKIMQFYQSIGIAPQFMHMTRPPQQPFIVQAPMHPMHPMQRRYQYPYVPMQPYVQRAEILRNNSVITHTQPPAKRMKLANTIKKIQKTKEQIENEKINRLKLPQNLINSNKLQQWLDEKLQLLREYENLIVKSIKNRKQLEEHKSCIRNLKRDIDILKSTVLQQNSNGLSQNKELKRVYLDIMKMDKDLPILREQHIKPLINQYVQLFDECNIKQIIKGQKCIKEILIKNKFDKRAKEYCNVSGKQFIKDKLFESEINKELNDDLELLNDFGVKFFVEIVNNVQNVKENRNEISNECSMGFNLMIKFYGNFGIDIDKEWKPPILIIMVNEKKYKHYYGMLPCFENLKERFVDFIFVLEDINNSEEDVDMVNGKFKKKHINWLDNYKMNRLKNNGEFVSIVNIYNFYVDGVKTLIQEISGKPKRKSV